MGIDSDFSFAFQCDTNTSKRIIEKHQLTLDTINPDYSSGIQHDLDWWDKEHLKTLPTYSWNNEQRFYKYYWYDSTKGKAYFFEFDM